MAIFKINKFRTTQEVEVFLNGGVTWGANAEKGFGGIVGKTLVFTQPSSTTVTFVAGASDPNGQNLSAFEAFSQIEAALSGLSVRLKDGQILIVEKAPNHGVVITGGTAMPMMGFSGGITGKVYGIIDGVTAPTVPYFVSAHMQNDYHVIITME